MTATGDRTHALNLFEAFEVAVGAGDYRVSCPDQRAAEAVFEPINSMALTGGPMKAIPAPSQARAKSGFSARNP